VTDLQKEDVLGLSVDEDATTYDAEMPRTSRTHRMHVLRMRLLFFVNSLHNYIMTRVRQCLMLCYLQHIF